MTQTSKREVIILNYSADHVTVEPQDEDRFVISARKAVEACKSHRDSEEFIKSFKMGLLKPLRKWCESHASKVQGCYIPRLVSAYLEVFMVGTSEKYDFDFGRELSTLEMEAYDSGWRINVMQIPKCDEEDLRSYFNPDGAIEIYGQFEPASQKITG